jgi:hypothetical protein
MIHEFKIGDIIRLNGTKQDAEIIELTEDDFRGDLLRVKLLGTPDQGGSVLYFMPQLVELVRPAGPEKPGKKPGTPGLLT